MLRRLFSQLRTLAPTRSTPRPTRFICSPTQAPVCQSLLIVSRQFSAESGNVTRKKKVEDVMPIATGHEREELATELEGKDLLEINYPAGPFGSKVCLYNLSVEDDYTISLL